MMVSRFVNNREPGAAATQKSLELTFPQSYVVSAGREALVAGRHDFQPRSSWPS